MLIAIQVDTKYSDKQLEYYLVTFLFTTLMSLFVLLGGILLNWIQFQVFLDNASDLIVMIIIALWVFFTAAKTAKHFDKIQNYVLNLYDRKIIFKNWDCWRVMQFLTYLQQSQCGFTVLGNHLNDKFVGRSIYLIGSLVAVAVGKKFGS